jgi:hypothetical protein
MNYAKEIAQWVSDCATCQSLFDDDKSCLIISHVIVARTI